VDVVKRTGKLAHEGQSTLAPMQAAVAKPLVNAATNHQLKYKCA
jgi:hypothetical protein